MPFKGQYPIINNESSMSKFKSGNWLLAEKPAVTSSLDIDDWILDINITFSCISEAWF
jgi:hypothetical protein